MTLRSDLNNEIMDAGSAAEIDIAFSNGRKRRLVVTVAQAEELASKGINISSARWRGLAWSRRHVGGFFKWAAVLLVASLVIPAVTKQWSDRTQALRLKEGMITDISGAASDAFNSARDLASSSGSEKTKAVTRRKLLNSWIHQEGRIDPRFHVYFEGSPANESWKQYKDRFFEYIKLACCDRDRSDHVADLQSFVSKRTIKFRGATVGDFWTVLTAGPKPNSEAFAADYRLLGELLLARRGNLLVALRHSKPSGYSQGPQDLACDVLGPIRDVLGPIC
jgi:hypothetical protein